jgi:hypothetical protein
MASSTSMGMALVFLEGAYFIGQGLFDRLDPLGAKKVDVLKTFWAILATHVSFFRKK